MQQWIIGTERMSCHTPHHRTAQYFRVAGTWMFLGFISYTVVHMWLTLMYIVFGSFCLCFWIVWCHQHTGPVWCYEEYHLVQLGKYSIFSEKKEIINYKLCGILPIFSGSKQENMSWTRFGGYGNREDRIWKRIWESSCCKTNSSTPHDLISCHWHLKLVLIQCCYPFLKFR